MIMEYRKLKDLKKLQNNPRVIKDKSFKSLCNSIENNPDYFEARPIILSDRTVELIIIAGNQRYEAAKKLKLVDVPTHLISGLSEEREKEIIIRDNVSNGDWDVDKLLSYWDKTDLFDWGVDLKEELDEKEKEEHKYTDIIKIPIYEPKNKKPKITDLINTSKRNELLTEIEASDIPKAEKEFLKLAAERHIIFDYSKIADYYSHSNKEIQDLFEKSALIIIDYDKALENGYIKLEKRFRNLFNEKDIDEDE